jgi:hypothetical protein
VEVKCLQSMCRSKTNQPTYTIIYQIKLSMIFCAFLNSLDTNLPALSRDYNNHSRSCIVVTILLAERRSLSRKNNRTVIEGKSL